MGYLIFALFWLAILAMPILLCVGYFREKMGAKAKVDTPVQAQQTPAFIPPAGFHAPDMVNKQDELETKRDALVHAHQETIPTAIIPATPSLAAPMPDGQKPTSAQADKLPRILRTRASNEAEFESIPDISPLPEGGRKIRTNYAVVRSAKLREAAILIHGRNCSVCGFNFDEAFGTTLAQGYIEIHHLNRIAAGVRHTDPARDLAPLCSNCHAMADRLTRHQKFPPTSIYELRKLLLPVSIQPDVEVIRVNETTVLPVKNNSRKIGEMKTKKRS